MYKSTLILLLSFLFILPASGQRDCVLKKHDDSIRVYTCAQANTRFKTIKAEFAVNTEFRKLASFLMNIENYVTWQYNTIQARVIQNVGPGEVVYYTEIAAPWPVSNRDMVTRIKIREDSVTKIAIIETNGEPGTIPNKPNIVRVPMSRATWTVTPVSSTRLEVKYVLEIDPGGSVPAWLINMVAAEAPHDSFKSLKEQIGKSEKGRGKRED